MKRIAVYCGASVGNGENFSNAAAQLGEWMIAHDYELVYGGGKFGLMGIIARAVKENGGVVWGVITKELEERGLSYNQATHFEVVPDMAVRKTKMLDLSDACIALPGGPGTLEEIAEAFSWAILGDTTNPCVFYNVDHYYDPLERMFDSMTQNGFMEAEHRQKLLFSDSLDEIQEFITHYQVPELRTYDK